MIICDSHIHSEFSDDSNAALDSIIERAIFLGLPKLCLTDHHDIDFVVQKEDGYTFQLDVPSYLEALTIAKEKYKDKIDLRFGVELGLMNTVGKKADQFYHDYPMLDFIIGSSHLVHGIDPYYPEYYEGRSEKEALHAYFESILENIQVTDTYDVYGHLDYIVRYCPTKENAFVFSEHAELFEEIFRIIIGKGKGIEINTAGLYKGLSYAHPHIDILRLYREMGGEIITVGSDAHKPDMLCYGFETTVRDMLDSLGYKYYCTFKNRTPEFNPL